MPVRQSARGRTNKAVLAAVVKSAVTALVEVDGRASGIKFNKLIYAAHKRLSAGGNTDFHFELPHRWYLYGAVSDERALWDFARFHRPDDEVGTDVELMPRHRSGWRTPEGLVEELDPFATEFARRFAGSEGVPAMLREHYVDAPQQFERDFLEWSLLTRSILKGYSEDSPERVASTFQKLETSFEAGFEPRLTPAFNRLALFLKPRVERRPFRDLGALDLDVGAMWDFWQVYCLFLSVRFNVGYSVDRVASFEARAETEADAYKRKIAAFLQAGYLKEAANLTGRPSDLVPVAQFLAGEVAARLDEGA